MTPPTLADWVAEVELWQVKYVRCQSVESASRNASTSALNNLNQAQRGLDDAVAALRMDAPQGSDWTRRAEP